MREEHDVARRPRVTGQSCAAAGGGGGSGGGGGGGLRSCFVVVNAANALFKCGRPPCAQLQLRGWEAVVRSSSGPSATRGRALGYCTCAFWTAPAALALPDLLPLNPSQPDAVAAEFPRLHLYRTSIAHAADVSAFWRCRGQSSPAQQQRQQQTAAAAASGMDSCQWSCASAARAQQRCAWEGCGCADLSPRVALRENLRLGRPDLGRFVHAAQLEGVDRSASVDHCEADEAGEHHAH
jgi:hypothetical protein